MLGLRSVVLDQPLPGRARESVDPIDGDCAPNVLVGLLVLDFVGGVFRLQPRVAPPGLRVDRDFDAHLLVDNRLEPRLEGAPWAGRRGSRR